MAQKNGHYCKVCGEYKSNESFSGKGHAAHICKKCAALPAAQRSENRTLTRLGSLPLHLSRQQLDWLKGLQNDRRPEVAAAAKEQYGLRFPYASRNARKKQLHVNHMQFTIHGEVFDEYGDSCFRELHFMLDRKAHTVQFWQEDKTEQVVLTIKEMRKLLNVIVNNYEVFCWEDDYRSAYNAADMDIPWDVEESDEREIFDEHDEPEREELPSWEISVSYLNGEKQEMCGYDELPMRINELTLELLALFEEKNDLDNFEEGDESKPDER